MLWSRVLGEFIRLWKIAGCDGGVIANSTPSILCSDFAIKRIDEPFVTSADDRNEWGL